MTTIIELLHRVKEYLTSIVIFTVNGSTYRVHYGTKPNCKKYIENLPSKKDKGWKWDGHSPFREACHIEANE